MFGRKKKDDDAVGVKCPYCEYNNPLGAETCKQCYYSLNKSAREQPMAEPTTSGEEIMSLLLGENEEEEDIGPVVEAVLAIDDVTVEVDQYASTTPAQDEDGTPVPDSFEFIGSEGPTLASTVESSEPEEVELTAADAPKEYVEFDLGTVDPMEEVAEPVHTGKGGLYSPTVETPKDEDLLGEVGPAPSATPDLPDLPDETVPTGGTLAQAMAAESPEVSPEPSVEAAVPDLPDLPDDEPVAEVAPSPSPEPQAEPAPQPAEDVDNRIWPWPKGDAWTPTQVYQEVVTAMEHVKHGRMEAAASTLDALGPHLDNNLDMLLHISVLLQHLGRHEHMKWTLDMAAYVHPNDPHVQQARTRLLA
ncbi:MAG: hypothetical protein CMO41_07015 [Verrucomicrobiales bacterium]|nr:hypothetical protein [Verrucomicrobiales bacterium]